MVVGCTWPEFLISKMKYSPIWHRTKLSSSVVAQGWPVQSHRLSKCGSHQAVKQVLSAGRQCLGWLCSRPVCWWRALSLHEVPSRLPRTQQTSGASYSHWLFFTSVPMRGIKGVCVWLDATHRSESLLKNPELRSPLIFYRGWWQTCPSSPPEINI